MSSTHYSRVIQQWCTATGMEAWAEHKDMHVEIGDTVIGLIHGGAQAPDDLHVYIDLGHLELPELYRSLLEQNIIVQADDHGCFGLHPLTNSIVYRVSMHLTEETDGAILPEKINQLIRLARARIENSLTN